MPNKLRYFRYELRRGLHIFWDTAINFIGIGIIIYGALLLSEYITTGKLGTESADMITIVIAVCAAVIIFVGFLVAFIFALIRTAQQDSKNIIVSNDKVFDGMVAPLFNIQINSNDFRYMDSSQIKCFFEGIKQSFAEYSKVAKEVQKHEQKDVEKRPTTKTRAKETKSKA